MIPSSYVMKDQRRRTAREPLLRRIVEVGAFACALAAYLAALALVA